MRDTIDMAREANLAKYGDGLREGVAAFINALERFEALVRADEQEKYKWDVHSCGPTCKRYACVAMREAVEAEREACAKVAETYREWDDTGMGISTAIRNRGNT
jgi:hypothetical protein